MIQEPPSRCEKTIDLVEVHTEALLADVFEHSDRGDRIEGAVGDVAVVLQSDLDLLGEPRLGHPFRRQVVLLSGDRDTDRTHAVVRCCVHSHTAPSAPDVEQSHTRSQVELATDQVVLVELSVTETLEFSPEHCAGVRHGRSQDQPIEVVRDVVVR